jgi:subtilisin-like proprotein convertase family protein
MHSANKSRTTALLLALFAVVPQINAQLRETNTFNAVHKMVPDGNASGMSDMRVISSSIAELSRVRVKLRIAGEFNGDLYGYVRQITPAATNFCVLINRPGRTASDPFGYDDMGIDVTFDEAAPNGDIHMYRNVVAPALGAPLTGVWQPDGRNVLPLSVTEASPRTTALNAFAGSPGSGEWTLFLADVESGGTNMLVSWSVELSGTTTPPLTWTAPANIVYGVPLGAAQLNASSPVAGTFSYNPPAGTVLDAGVHTLAVTFTPDDSGAYDVVSTNVTITVVRAATTATLASSANPALPGQQVTFTFTANAVAPSGATPTGTVLFRIGGTSTSVPLVNGTATLSTSTLTVGNHSVIAEFAGTANFIGTTNRLSPDQLINTPPIAAADAVRRYLPNGAKVRIATLLGNDSDGDSHSLTFVSFSSVSANGGTITRDGDWLQYTAPAGFTNDDSFTYTITDGLGQPVTGLVNIRVNADPVPSPNLMITALGDGSMRIRFDGIPDVTYRIEYTDSLSTPNWQTLGSRTADETGLFELIDNSPAPSRVYRSAFP